MPVGCLTQISSYVAPTGKPMNVRHTVEQDWFLHPTKGWKRGPKRKTSKSVLWNDWPRVSFREVWKRY